MKRIRAGYEITNGRPSPTTNTFADIVEAGADSWPAWVRESYSWLSIGRCDRHMINRGFLAGLYHEEISDAEVLEKAREAIAETGDDFVFNYLADGDEELAAHLLKVHDLAYLVGQCAGQIDARKLEQEG